MFFINVYFYDCTKNIFRSFPEYEFPECMYIHEYVDKNDKSVPENLLARYLLSNKQYSLQNIDDQSKLWRTSYRLIFLSMTDDLYFEWR